MEERLIKLETLSAMQDETIAKLNGEIYQQQQDIARLRRRMEELEQRLGEMEEPGEIGGNEKPPHY
ncbi:MAG: SlyX family protein [Kiritimatiellales bacterium]|nr:SlyX family protein [Kiritimatiellales bacterium]